MAFSGIGVVLIFGIIKLMRERQSNKPLNENDDFNHDSTNDKPVRKDGNRSVKLKESTGGVIGDNPVIYNGVQIYNYPEKMENADPYPSFDAEIQTYCKKAESLNSSLPVAGFAKEFKVPIDIEDIYIPLRAMVNLRGIDDIECYGDSSLAHEHFARSAQSFNKRPLHPRNL